MKSNTQRLNNIIGQIEGVKKMMESKTDCVSVLTQLKAIKSAVAGVMDAVVEEQFETCLKSLKDEDKKLLVKMKNYVKSN
ncbi:MAG TPA: metal-sensitive transcriptional regulator [Patescibacteria group bacterium]